MKIFPWVSTRKFEVVQKKHGYVELFKKIALLLTYATNDLMKNNCAGIPKFYRWLSERYPLVNQPGGATVVPIIDNFYLDMNGIIHNCTHGNSSDVKLTEDEMIVRIFTYLDKLFHIVKPQKVMFMAIDGKYTYREPELQTEQSFQVVPQP